MPNPEPQVPSTTSLLSLLLFSRYPLAKSMSTPLCLTGTSDLPYPPASSFDPSHAHFAHATVQRAVRNLPCLNVPVVDLVVDLAQKKYIGQWVELCNFSARMSTVRMY